MDLLQWRLQMVRKSEPFLDRNGLRPARYYVTKDDSIFLALKQDSPD